jgi:hypothetical protein
MGGRAIRDGARHHGIGAGMASAPLCRSKMKVILYAREYAALSSGRAGTNKTY